MMKLIGWAFFFICTSLFLSSVFDDRNQQFKLPENAKGINFDLVKPHSPGYPFSLPAMQRTIRVIDGTVINEEQVNYILSKLPLEQTNGSFAWGQGDFEVSTVAKGMDRNFHFANSFLVNFVPFKEVAAWVPVAALSRNKAYETDIKNNHVLDLWQTSQEAFYYPTGDCEDHSIALADWLIGLGYDARVVLGTVDNIGHAWVIIIYESKVYLVEATDKSQRNKFTIPLAEYYPGYLPYAMFNRETYWVNTGSKLGSNYLSQQWANRSNYAEIKLP